MIVLTRYLTVSAVRLSLDPAGGFTERRRFLCDATQRNKNGTATWHPLLYALHGLLVLQQRPGLYIICNPVTRQWTNLPVLAPEPCFTAFPCGFYFHSSSGEYRLLCHGDEAGWGAAGASLAPHDFFQLPRCPELIRLKFPD
ncbi:hypothetical protein C2845_PM06G04260 [Panicum miliaceum]|uniref:F-box protein n=1 Tax=Panicum miliaceum TaxID=4540 RepID=A0A3L6R9L2_PANMI|nr:hypothetical protein C2845_PM06G04260 [Panicum miliaceum]